MISIYRKIVMYIFYIYISIHVCGNFVNTFKYNIFNPNSVSNEELVLKLNIMWTKYSWKI